MCKIFSFLIYFSIGWHPKNVCKWKTNEKTVPMHPNSIRMGINDGLCVKLKFESIMTQKFPNTNFQYVRFKCICAMRVQVFERESGCLKSWMPQCIHTIHLNEVDLDKNTDNNVLFSKDVENCWLTFQVISISFRFVSILLGFILFATNYQHRILFIWILLYVWHLFIFFPFSFTCYQIHLEFLTFSKKSK